MEPWTAHMFDCCRTRCRHEAQAAAAACGQAPGEECAPVGQRRVRGAELDKWKSVDTWHPRSWRLWKPAKDQGQGSGCGFFLAMRQARDAEAMLTMPSIAPGLWNDPTGSETMNLHGDPGILECWAGRAGRRRKMAE